MLAPTEVTGGELVVFGRSLVTVLGGVELGHNLVVVEVLNFTHDLGRESAFGFVYVEEAKNFTRHPDIGVAYSDSRHVIFITFGAFKSA